MKNQTFGIEIETTGLSRQSVALIIANYFNTNSYYIGGGYNAQDIKDITKGFKLNEELSTYNMWYTRKNSLIMFVVVAEN